MVRDLSNSIRSKMQNAIPLDGLLTREIHCKVAHVHAGLHPRRSSSRRANRRLLSPVIICGCATVVDVRIMRRRQPRRASRIFHVCGILFAHTHSGRSRTLHGLISANRRDDKSASKGYSVDVVRCCRLLVRSVRVLNGPPEVSVVRLWVWVRTCARRRQFTLRFKLLLSAPLVSRAFPRLHCPTGLAGGAHDLRPQGVVGAVTDGR